MKHGAFSLIQKEMTKFAMKTANIPVTQESSHVKITNEDNASDPLKPLLIHSTRPSSQPSLLCGHTEVIMWSSV